MGPTARANRARARRQIIAAAAAALEVLDLRARAAQDRHAAEFALGTAGEEER